MIRNLKIFGASLALVAVMSTAMASTASAVPQFTASSYPATVTGIAKKGFDILSTEGGKIECDVHYVSHAIGGPTSTLTFTTTTNNCEAFGFLSATVDSEGCTDVLHATEKVSNNVYRIHLDKVCPAGQSVKINASTCKLEIKGQTGLTTVTGINIGGAVVIQPGLSKIAYTVTQDGFLCPFGGTGNKTDGTHTGESTASRVGGGIFSISGA